MYPVIYDFGVVDLFGFQFRLAIYSFGLMLVVAFYTCYFLLDRDLKELGYDEKLASDIIFWSALGGIVGSKVYHVIENLDQIMSSNNPMSLIFSGSGLVFLGGLVGAIIAAGSIDIELSGLWDSITVTSILGFVAIIFATINVVGGFLVTDRMLKMFKR